MHPSMIKCGTCRNPLNVFTPHVCPGPPASMNITTARTSMTGPEVPGFWLQRQS